VLPGLHADVLKTLRDLVTSFGYFNAMNSVHFCSVTFRSNQMHYFYYLKLKTIYNISL
jgi:hypothetical protein